MYLLKLGFEVSVLLGEQPSLWEEFVIFRELFAQLHQVPAQVILFG